MNAATYLYISPHLDDAVLSAGGLMASLLQKGERVVIATVCTSDPPVRGRLSPLANAVHRQWGNPPEPYARRRQEDIEACKTLGGAEFRHLGFPDAIYRSKQDCPEHHYDTFDDLFGPIPTWDREFTTNIDAALNRLIAEVRPQMVFGPLGVGRNVDHLHLRNAILRISECVSAGFYEDQPYATGRYPAIAAQPVKLAVQASPVPLRSERIAVDWELKLKAVQCYQSQLLPLFGPELAGLSEMEHYSRALCSSQRPQERVWYL